MRRRGQASIIGSILFFVLFAAAMGGISYYASSQSQANGAVNRAQSLQAQKSSEQLTFGALSNGSLTLQNTGSETARVIEVVVKYANGTVYSASPNTAPMASNNVLQVGALIPSSLQSRYNAILGSTSSADEIGVVTSRGNTFWLKPAVAAQTNPNLTYGVTFDASGTGSFGPTPVVTVDGVGYAASQLPVTLSWFAGTKHTYSFATSLPLGTGSRIGVGSVQGISTSPSGTLTATTTGTIRTSYSTQYQLTVSGGSAVAFIGSPSNDGWYDSGSTGQFTSNYVWSTSSGSRSNLVSYSLDGSSPASVTRSGTGTYTSISITMTAPHTITLSPVTQYQLTAAGGNGIGYSLASQTNDGWYDSGSSLTVSSNYIWSQVAAQSRQNMLSYTLDGTPANAARSSSGTFATPTITMNAAHALTFNPVTQYYLTVSGGTGTASVGSQTGDGWFDAGSNAEAQSGYSWSTITGQSRNNLYSYAVDGGSPTSVSSRAGSGTYTTPAITMSTYHTLAFSPVTQYLLTVNGGTNLVYTTSPTSDGWYDAGTSAEVTTNYVWSVVAGQSRQDLTSWNVDGTADTVVARSGSGNITVTATASMTTYHTVNFNGLTQYTLNANGGNSITYSGSITNDGWFDSGSTATATTNYVWSVIAGQSRLNLVSWNLDGGANQAVTRADGGTFTTTSVTMNAFHTVNFNSVAQYLLSLSGGNAVAPSPGSPTGDGFYDSGTALTVSSNWVWGTVSGQSRTAIVNWQLDGVSQSPTRAGSGTLTTSVITMNTFHTVAFTSTTQYYVAIADNVPSSGSVAGLTTNYSPYTAPSTESWSVPSFSSTGTVYPSPGMPGTEYMCNSGYHIPCFSGTMYWSGGSSDPSHPIAFTLWVGQGGSYWCYNSFAPTGASGSQSFSGGGYFACSGPASSSAVSFEVTQNPNSATIWFSGTWSYAGSYSGGSVTGSSSYSVSGTTVTYSHGVGYNFPGGATGTSWSATWPSAESYSTNNCAGGSISGITISGTGSSCTLTTTQSGSFGLSMSASQTGDGWYDTGSAPSISASPSGPFSFSSWSSSSGSLPVTSSSSASTTINVGGYGTVTANFNVNE